MNRSILVSLLLLVACKSPEVTPDAGRVLMASGGPVGCTLTTPCPPILQGDLGFPTHCVGSSCVALPPGQSLVRIDTIAVDAGADYCSAISALPSCGFNTCVFLYDPGPLEGGVKVFGYASVDGGPPAPANLAGCWRTPFTTPFHHGVSFWCPSSLLEAGAACTN